MPNNASHQDVPTPRIAEIVGRNIALAREAQQPKMSQHALALRIGARADQVSNWERGRHRPDTYMPALCEALGRDLPWFYEDRTPTDDKAAA